MPNLDIVTFEDMAEEVASTLVAISQHAGNKELDRALMTERVDNHVFIGDYVISRGDDHRYMVSKNGHVLVHDLVLYDMALKIANLAADGVAISSRQVFSMKTMNDEYIRAINDMNDFQERMERYWMLGQDSKAHVAEDRLGIVQARARHLMASMKLSLIV